LLIVAITGSGQLADLVAIMNRERFDELAKLKGMDVTRANRRITFVNLEVIEVGEYISRMTEAAWWGWQEAMKESKDD
jgi:hypothetical protein